VVRLVVLVAIALNPMVILYGGNGMSEALYLLTMTMTTRYLLRWLRRGDLISLVYAAAALGLGYLARNEAVLSAFFGGLTVLAITFLGTAGVLRQRLAAALTDFVIFLAPVVTSFAAWAVASYVITKQWFAQFSSMYGTTSQLKIAPNSVTTHSGRLIEEVKGIEALAPLLVVMLVIAVVLAWRRRDLAVLAPITVLGGGLAFDFSEYFLNNLAWSLRYYILSIPLGILLTGALFADLPPVRASWTTPSYRLRRVAAGDRPPPRVHRWAIGLAGAVVAFLLVLPTLPTTVEAMGNSQLGSLELQGLGFIFHSPPDAADRGYADHWQHVKDMDDYLESLHLGNGQVLMDNFPGCAPDLIIESDDPRMFVIPNDRDFQRTLAAPITFNAHYMMLPAPTGLNGLDAISDEYPRMYENGAGIATLVHTFLAGGACSAWRLYHVYKTASTTS
ncbi:MAG TPA: hypothetical protein VMD59_24190, partial [Acidimicrobiales bacterium]|nr:hypothetical protein [Acidimicrobiales bacterium]